MKDVKKKNKNKTKGFRIRTDREDRLSRTLWESVVICNLKIPS